MICDNCRQGGALNVIGEYNMSDGYHHACHVDKTPGCFCQHRTGPALVIGRDDAAKDKARLRA